MSPGLWCVWLRTSSGQRRVSAHPCQRLNSAACTQHTRVVYVRGSWGVLQVCTRVCSEAACVPHLCTYALCCIHIVEGVCVPTEYAAGISGPNPGKHSVLLCCSFRTFIHTRVKQNACPCSSKLPSGLHGTLLSSPHVTTSHATTPCKTQLSA